MKGFRKRDAIVRYGETIEGKLISSFTGYAKALLTAIMQVHENQHLHGDDWQRTIYIDTLDVKTTDFDLSDKKRKPCYRKALKELKHFSNGSKTLKKHP